VALAAPDLEDRCDSLELFGDDRVRLLESSALAVAVHVPRILEPV
jgi:hypothetical protein